MSSDVSNYFCGWIIFSVIWLLILITNKQYKTCFMYQTLHECDRQNSLVRKTFACITVLTQWPSNLWPPAGSSVRFKLSWPPPIPHPVSLHPDLRPPRGADDAYLLFVGSLHLSITYRHDYMTGLCYRVIYGEREKKKHSANWIFIF